MTGNLRYVIGSDPDHEDLVADLMLDDVGWGAITSEGGVYVLELYPHPDGTVWQLPIDAADELLHKALTHLRSLERPRE